MNNNTTKQTTYTARVDRLHPTAFVFLVDQSGSMHDTLNFDGESMSKAQAVANAINSIFEEIISRCTKPNELRHYFDIAVIGYSGNSANYIFSGKDGSEWISPQELSDSAKYREEEVEVNIRGKIIKQLKRYPYWIEPKADYTTPMHDAFSKAVNLLKDWCNKQAGNDCYPPVVINITDGEQTDAEDSQMIEIANTLKGLQTIDGNVLLFNIHLSANNNSSAVVFPCSESEVSTGGTYSQMLFEMSSLLPKSYNNDISALKGDGGGSGYRAMGFNTRADFVRMLNIGTMTTMATDNAN